MKAQVNFINQILTTWSARLLKVLGLTAVAVTLFTVVDAKFDHLRLANSRMPQHMITAEQRMKELDCLTRNIYTEPSRIGQVCSHCMRSSVPKECVLRKGSVPIQLVLRSNSQD